MPIPTHLITGFLGVGKTTAIRHLLAHRPAGERWAVLVNEFGQVGVDEQLMEGEDVAIRQVPGGCLCCVSSQAFTVGLNRLIREERPARILIEPTGLGHPARVIETLTGEFYRQVLDLRAVITLIDARHLASPRHRTHPTWQDQIALADVLVANKADLYSDAEREAFLDFARRLDPPKSRTALVSQGALDPAWLDLPAHPKRSVEDTHDPLGDTHHPGHDDLLGDTHHPEYAHGDLLGDTHHPEYAHGDSHDSPAGTRSDWFLATQHGDGYHGISWLLGPAVRLAHEGLIELLHGGAWDRTKGVLHTDRGWFTLNRVSGEGTLEPRTPGQETRLEIIHHAPLDAGRLDARLRSLRL
ncbi:CobW family GTP-binding protein [Thioalkalivibrio sulfidiphilus]|uniref:CobW family GTP-binding protein n=1 Tax=Thioalkalivibrio sulfidiphilus TaxID=1033854 RepID=UPI0003774432|nr:GTP-binding protein [Thioalkalivibrio sulfidiphilus]